VPTLPIHGRRRSAPLAVIGLLLSSTLALAPTAVAAGLTLSTPYPSVVVGPGTTVGFDIAIVSNPNEQVGLALSGVPSGWTATLRGGGYVIKGVQTDASGNATVRLELKIPGDAADGSSKVTLSATAGAQRAALPLNIQLSGAAAGDVTLTSDYPSLQGASGTNFTFNFNLKNDSAEDLTFAVTAVGPEGWEVNATLTGQSQAASAVVKASNSAGVSVSVKPPTDVPPGTYDINVRATVGDRTIDAKPTVVITGTNSLTLSTPDQRLSNSGAAGSSISQQLVLHNGGTQPLENVVLSATAPTDWTVTFSPSETVASVAAGQDQTITATVVPSNDAIAGDYVVTYKATAANANGTVEIRMTIETSPLFGLFGLALIALVLFGLWWVFQRYGRR
jgi:uncharacterized membrane protein